MSAGKPTLDELVQEIESVRRQLEREREITARILRLTSSSNDLHDLVREATSLLREWSGCDAVGIRLREGDDFPYFETRGFPPQFVQAENTLCVRDCDGQLVRDLQSNAVLECMCGNILCGRFDATLPFFTFGGSFWTNSTTKLLASTTEADRQARTRNRCNSAGYESVALIPLRSAGHTLGLMQLNDRRRGRFTAGLIDLLESLGHALAEAIARRAAAVESESLLAIERDLAAALSGTQDVDEVMQRTLRAALDATGFNCGGVYLLDDTTHELRLACHAGLSPEFVRAAAAFGHETEHAQVIASGQFVQVDGQQLMAPAFADVQHEGIQAMLVAPVTHEGQSIACLNLGSRTANRIAPHARHAVEAITALMGVALDRVRAAASLRQYQAELRAVYDNSPIMMCVLDSRLCLLYMNRTMSEFIGKTEEELRYQRAVGIIGCVNALEDPHGCGYGTDCQACALRMALEDTLATGRSHSGIERSMTLVCGDGQREVTLLAATALIQTEAGKSLLVCLEDITRQLADEQRLADMQLQLHHTSRLAAMGELAAGIAHEVNQPLCSIVNFANACRNVASSEAANWGQIRIWSDAIASSAAQAGDITRRLISFARRPQADREAVQVQQLFDDAILLVQHEARANRVAVRLATADPGLTVHAQPVPIRQVMVNLLRNSIDALGVAASPSRPGAHRQVVVQAARVAEGVEIAVVDNGPGVSESVLPKVFEPFYTTKSQGLGLGLVISRTIVEDHGGKIWATANRDGGLAVRFTLPAGRD